jgi:hypothetical protein
VDGGRPLGEHSRLRDNAAVVVRTARLSRRLVASEVGPPNSGKLESHGSSNRRCRGERRLRSYFNCGQSLTIIRRAFQVGVGDLTQWIRYQPLAASLIGVVRRSEPNLTISHRRQSAWQ